MTAPATHHDIEALDPARWAARRTRQMRAWRRRSELIRRLRRILPATIAAVLVILTGWVLVKGWLTRFAEGRAGGAAIHMTNAHFYGRDGQGHAFVLGAAEASRSNSDIQLISLSMPLLEFNADELKPSRITARKGAYREDTHFLSLSDHVVLVDGAGDTFTTDQAVVDTVHAVVTGWSKVTGIGPRGTITADSYGIYDRGQRVVFSGNVHSIIKPN
jgi:lipopolysaccharide export system protein LptC